MAIESLIKKQYLQLYLFNSPTPSQLSPNDNFLLNKSLAGKMVSKPDTTIYYAVSPLSKVSKMAVHKQDSLKMFVYDGADQVLDSFPLRPGKYTALYKSRDDVFLLYRGWLELQSQQIQEALRQTMGLLHGQDTNLYLQTYRIENKKQLLLAEAELRVQQQEIERKINTLVIPDKQLVECMLQDAYPDMQSEITYLSVGIGFAYTTSNKRGEKLYELSDHRGNVMTTASDEKAEVDNGDGTVAYYNVDVVSANDYYPFGSLMSGRTYSSSEKYRYGFNGKENDNEVEGEGNQQNYGLRIYDPRIARFLSTDPLTAKFPWYTPYQFAGNTPVQADDLDGAEKWMQQQLIAVKQKAEIQVARAELIRQKLWASPEPHIMIQDVYGNAHMGPVSSVTPIVSSINNDYRNSLGEAIASGPISSASYLLDGDRGAFRGAVFDQMSLGLGGFSSEYSTMLVRPLEAPLTISIPNTEALYSGGISIDAPQSINMMPASESTPRAKPTQFIRTETVRGNESARTVGANIKIIREGGSLAPIEVADINDKLYVINGHHRLEAALRTNTEIGYKILSREQWMSYGYKSEGDIISHAVETHSIKLDSKVIAKAAGN